jgi:hypothetical protein
MNAPNLTLIEAIASELADYRDDEEAFWTTLDGETDAVDLLDTFLTGMQDDEALADAITRQIDELAARARRIEDRARAKKRTLGLILAAAGMKKAERPRGTISLSPGRVGVRIVNEADIPTQLMRVKTTMTPDKTAIKAQIEAGADVPGAELERGADIVTIRVA